MCIGGHTSVVVACSGPAAIVWRQVGVSWSASRGGLLLPAVLAQSPPGAVFATRRPPPASQPAGRARAADPEGWPGRGRGGGVAGAPGTSRGAGEGEGGGGGGRGWRLADAVDGPGGEGEGDTALEPRTSPDLDLHLRAAGGRASGEAEGRCEVGSGGWSTGCSSSCWAQHAHHAIAASRGCALPGAPPLGRAPGARSTRCCCGGCCCSLHCHPAARRIHAARSPPRVRLRRAAPASSL